MNCRRMFLLTLPLLLVSCGGAQSTSESSSSVSSAPSSSTESSASSSSIISSSEPSSSDASTESESSSPSEHSSESEPSSEYSSVSSSDHFDPASLYGGYYKDLVSWTDGEDLKRQLHDIISGGTYAPIEYASPSNWNSNKDADHGRYDFEFLDVVYSDQDVWHELTTSSWQREHAFCATLMCGAPTNEATSTLGRATDFHNLFASSASANSSRGNKNYGVANKGAASYQNRTTGNGADGYSFDNKNFEPGDKDKGRLSRAIFYMATMYCDDDPATGMRGLSVVEEYVDYQAGNDHCAFAIGNLSDLLDWSKLSVDLQEYQHNESVYSYCPPIHGDPELNHPQGNRNPYVDFPGLVDYVFGEKKEEAGALSDVTSSWETLGCDEDDVRNYAIEYAKRSYALDEPFHKEDLSVLAVSYDGTKTPFDDFEVLGASDDEMIDGSGDVTLTVRTPYDDIEYTVRVENDPILSADWYHAVTGKAKGCDFEYCFENAANENLMEWGGVDWNVYWQQGQVSTTSTVYGAKFGANASNPVRYLRFQTVDEFIIDGKSLIDAIYLRGASSSGKTTTVTFSIGETVVATQSLGYDKDQPLSVGAQPATPQSGRITIELSNITAAVYVQYLAVHAHASA